MSQRVSFPSSNDIVLDEHLPFDGTAKSDSNTGSTPVVEHKGDLRSIEAMNDEVDIEYEDGDEPPESLSFAAGKSAALQNQLAEGSSVRKLKQAAKNKKLEREAFLVEQKLKKKIRLEKLVAQKLSDEVLVNVSSEPNIKSDDQSVINETETVEVAPKKVVKQRSRLAVPDNIKEVTEDYLPLDSKLTEFHVKVMPKHEEQFKMGGIIGNAEALVKLKNRMIFGKRSSRETTFEALSKKKKLELTGLDKFPIINKR